MLVFGQLRFRIYPREAGHSFAHVHVRTPSSQRARVDQAETLLAGEMAGCQAPRLLNERMEEAAPGMKSKSLREPAITKDQERALLRRARDLGKKLPAGRNAWYDEDRKIVFVALDNGSGGVIGLPRAAFRFLEHANDADVADIETGAFDVNWPKFDDGACLWWFIEEALGGHAAFQSFAAFIRGTSRSPKKVAAARRNGRKGGRPRKKAA